MDKTIKRLLAATAVAATFGVASPAHASFVATICNDIQCTGGDDFVVFDSLAGDTIASLGAISFSQVAFGYTIVVNTSQSKPMVGSGTAPQLVLSFIATTSGPLGPSS